MLEPPETRRSRFAVYNENGGVATAKWSAMLLLTKAVGTRFAANADPIRLQNPLAAQYAVMRSTLIGGLVEILQNNLNRKTAACSQRFRRPALSKRTHRRLVVRRGNARTMGRENAQCGFLRHQGRDVENLLKNKAVEFVKNRYPAPASRTRRQYRFRRQSHRLCISANCIRNGCKIRPAASAAGI